MGFLGGFVCRSRSCVVLGVEEKKCSACNAARFPFMIVLLQLQLQDCLQEMEGIQSQVKNIPLLVLSSNMFRVSELVLMICSRI